VDDDFLDNVLEGAFLAEDVADDFRAEDFLADPAPPFLAEVVFDAAPPDCRRPLARSASRSLAAATVAPALMAMPGARSATFFATTGAFSATASATLLTAFGPRAATFLATPGAVSATFFATVGAFSATFLATAGAFDAAVASSCAA